jgi:hypothetical protein
MTTTATTITSLSTAGACTRAYSMPPTTPTPAATPALQPPRNPARPDTRAPHSLRPPPVARTVLRVPLCPHVVAELSRPDKPVVLTITCSRCRWVRCRVSVGPREVVQEFEVEASEGEEGEAGDE